MAGRLLPPGGPAPRTTTLQEARLSPSPCLCLFKGGAACPGGEGCWTPGHSKCLAATLVQTRLLWEVAGCSPVLDVKTHGALPPAS